MIKTTHDIVFAILEKDDKARNSDDHLIYVVCKAILESQGLDIRKMSFGNIILHRAEYGIPPFETIRRTRQKVQMEHPELGSNDTVQGFRRLKEDEFREYSRKGV